MSGMFKINCVICYTEIQSEQLPPCCCHVCIDCIFNWIKVKNMESLHIKQVFRPCPNNACQVKEIMKSWIEEHFSLKQLEELSDLGFQKYINSTDDILRCPKLGCNFAGYFNTENRFCPNDYECNLCGYNWKSASDQNVQATTINAIFKRYYDEFSELRISLFTRSCISCERNIYKYQGCDHITCLCRKEFCYNCLADWSNHNSNNCFTKSSIQGSIMSILVIIFMMKIILSFNFVYLIFYYFFWSVFIQILGMSYLGLNFIAIYCYITLVLNNGYYTYSRYFDTVEKLMDFYNKNKIFCKFLLTILFLLYLYGMVISLLTYESLYFSIKLIISEIILVAIIYFFVYLVYLVTKMKKYKRY